MKILVTGFDPFGGELINPAFEAIKRLPNRIGNTEIIKLEVPTVFEKAAKKTIEILEKEQADIVICVGQAGGRTRLSLEKVAINWLDARIPDNEGNQPLQQPINQDGPNAYFSTLPLNRMVNSIQKKQLPIEISYTAGTFVCNELMYQMLDFTAKLERNVIAGFVHVPFIPSQVLDRPGVASLSIETITATLEAGLEAIVYGEGENQTILSGTIC